MNQFSDTLNDNDGKDVTSYIPPLNLLGIVTDTGSTLRNDDDISQLTPISIGQGSRRTSGSSQKETRHDTPSLEETTCTESVGHVSSASFPDKFILCHHFHAQSKRTHQTKVKEGQRTFRNYCELCNRDKKLKNKVKTG